MHTTLRSFSHALRGLGHVWMQERNFRFHSLAAVVILGLAFYFRFTLIEIGFVVFAIILVIGSEILNTVVEDTLDEIHPQHHKVIGSVKDMMAALVLVNSLGAAVIGVLVFLNHFEISLSTF